MTPTFGRTSQCGVRRGCTRGWAGLHGWTGWRDWGAGGNSAPHRPYFGGWLALRLLACWPQNRRSPDDKIQGPTLALEWVPLLALEWVPLLALEWVPTGPPRNGFVYVPSGAWPPFGYLPWPPFGYQLWPPFGNHFWPHKWWPPADVFFACRAQKTATTRRKGGARHRPKQGGRRAQLPPPFQPTEQPNTRGYNPF